MNWFRALWWSTFVAFVMKGFGVPPFEACPWWLLGAVLWLLLIIATIRFFTINYPEYDYE